MKQIIINNENFSYLKGKVSENIFHSLVDYLSSCSADSVKDLVYLVTNPSHVEYLIEHYDVDINDYNFENIHESSYPDMINMLTKHDYKNIFQYVQKFILSQYLKYSRENPNASEKEINYTMKIEQVISDLFEQKGFPEKIAENYDCCLFLHFFNKKKLDIKPYIRVSLKNNHNLGIYKTDILKELEKNIGISELKKWITSPEKKSLFFLPYGNIYNLIKSKIIEKSFLNEMFEHYGKKKPLYSLFFYENLSELFTEENGNIIPQCDIDFSLINKATVNELFDYCRRGNTTYRNIFFRLLPDDKLVMLNSDGQSILHVHAKNNDIPSLAHVITLFLNKGLDLNLLDEKGNTFVKSITNTNILIKIITNNVLFDINKPQFTALKKDLFACAENNPFLNYLILTKEKSDLLQSVNVPIENKDNKKLKKRL